jgi:hypothetical protein
MQHDDQLGADGATALFPRPIRLCHDRPWHVDAEPIDAATVEAIVRLQQAQPAHPAFDCTPAAWWYGGLLHMCFDLLCHAACLDHVRPLFRLAHAITRDPHRRYMLRTTNYFGEMPVHTITDRHPGRANASYVLYRMCMHDSRMYAEAMRGGWARLRWHAARRAHARRFRACLGALGDPPSHQRSHSPDAAATG